MTDDLARQLVQHGISVPTLDPLPDVAGVSVFAFLSAGDEALEWWRRLNGVGAHTGYWPVLASPDHSLLRGQTFTSGVSESAQERLRRVAELDAAEVLNPRGMTLESQGEERQQEMLADWPDPPNRIDGFGLPFSRDGQPAPTLVTLVAAEHSWQIPALLGYGGWNTCPEPAVHSAVLRHWYDRYGLELVCMAERGLELAVARPPRTELAALAFAWEYASYCTDSVDAIYDADTLADLAASLIDAEIVLTWWD